MKDIDWRDGHLPISTRFDDPYYSKEDGRAETNHVFIHGNELPTRWRHMQHCSIAELGFGTGLNFLETIRQWKTMKPNGATLDFISFEQFPMSGEEMAKALSKWPELEPLANRLIDRWNSKGEIFSFCLQSELVEGSIDEGCINLTVHFGDANEILSRLSFKADAWYLDGFSPAKNLELWNECLMQEVGKHTVADGTFATYTAAGFVRRNLASAGFDVLKSKGFGRKRDMLTGKLSNDIDVAKRH